MKNELQFRGHYISYYLTHTKEIILEIKVTVKQLGRKHPLLQEQVLDIDLNTAIPTVKELLEAVVAQQVALYNAKEPDTDTEDRTHTPSHKYLQVLTETGKAGFGSIYNTQKADLPMAQENALLAFEDGLFAIFYGDEELRSLTTPIDLSHSLTFTFIRLVFLAGSIW